MCVAVCVRCTTWNGVKHAVAPAGDDAVGKAHDTDLPAERLQNQTSCLLQRMFSSGGVGATISSGPAEERKMRFSSEKAALRALSQGVHRTQMHAWNDARFSWPPII